MTTSAIDHRTLLRLEFLEHSEVTQATESVVRADFCRLVAMCGLALRGRNKLLLFGNGGSAGDAQHLAAELTVRYRTNRPAIAAIALTTDASALTAIGNDLGFDYIFSRQLEAVARPGDVAIGISTSGNSRNVILGLQTAKLVGCHAAAFSGNEGGHLRGLADPLLIVPSRSTARIQEMHILLGQALCHAIEYELGYAEGEPK